ncbi:ABC transporter substrate-binding protein [Deltaproteobacteria bacterium]|nr:ABC transporter substrate-binding protein [Deltaproteobacteria bacterium]
MKKVSYRLSCVALFVSMMFFSSVNNALPAQNPDNHVIRYGLSLPSCENVMIAAFEKGFITAEGVNLELVKIAPGKQYELIGTGSVDSGLVLMEQAIQPLANGLEAKIVTGLHSGCAMILAPKESGITKLGDLKGKRIGVHSFTAGSYMFAVRAISEAGIKAGTRDGEVEFVVLPNPELPLALSRGAVDAIAVFDPVASLAVNEYGYTVVASLASKEYASQVCCAALVSNKFIAEHPEVAARFTIALQKAAQWISEGNEEELGKILFEKKYVSTSPELNTQILRSYRHDSEIYSIKNTSATFAASSKALQKIGVLDSKVDVEALQKNSFVFLEGVK